MKTIFYTAAALATVLAAPAFAAASIGNTGVDTNWQVAALGSTATQPASTAGTYTMAQTVASPDHYWVSNNAGSQWVSLTSSAGQNPGWYAYQNTFTAAAGDSLNFKYAVDDIVAKVLLNGSQVAGTWGGTYSAFTEASISGLAAGSNTLTFLIQNNYPGQDNGVNPSGFRFQNIAAVPEPATWAMMLLGFGMVAGAARYRRRATNVRYA